MYEGWFCFGGTEIINNSRAVGYATTASQLFDTGNPISPAIPPVEVARNWFLNPSFEKTVGAAPEIDRNRHLNPDLLNDLNGWGYFGGTANLTTSRVLLPAGESGLTRPGAVAHFAATASGIASAYIGLAVPVTEGETITGTFYLRRGSGWTGTATPRFAWSGGGSAVGTAQTMQNGSYTRYVVTAVVPIGVTTARLNVLVTTMSTGNTFRVRMAMIETGDAPTAYFDGAGSETPDPDLTASWVGTVGNSPSILSGMPVYTMFSGELDGSFGHGPFGHGPFGGGGATAHVIRSNYWAKEGSYSMRILPADAPGFTDTYAQTPSNGVTSIGTRYTVIGTVYIPVAQTGFINPRARSIVVTDGANQYLSTPAPNEPGEHEVRLTFTATTTDDVMVRFYNGSDTTSVWWDLTYFGREWLGDAFTGDTAPFQGHHYEWNGPPNESMSILVRDGMLGEYANYCDIRWFEEKLLCDNLFLAVEGVDNDGPYEAGLLNEQAPWHSDTSGFGVPSPSLEFLGAYALSASSLSDSTRQVGITEGILDGGVLGRSRRAVPTFRFRVMLTAVTEAGLEYGTAWLSKALEEQTCSTHGPSCGSTDLTFFAACPPAMAVEGGMTAYEDAVNSITRMYHDVKCIEGPIVVQEMRRPEKNAYGRIVEFTLAAGVPYMFGVPSLSGEIPQVGQVIVLDAPFNYVTHPSAEIAGSSLTVATNYSLNPSVETDDTGWARSNTTISGTSPAAFLTSGRVTGELQAVGTSSYRVRLLGDSTVASGRSTFDARQEVDLTAKPAGARISFSIWAALLTLSGASVTTLHSLQAHVQWRNAGGTSVGNVPLESVTAPDEMDGHIFSARSLVPPATAVKALVYVRADVTWASGATNSDVRLYADAIAVTVP